MQDAEDPRTQEGFSEAGYASGRIRLECNAEITVTNSLNNPPIPPEQLDDVPHHKYIDYLGDGTNHQTNLTGAEYYRLYLDVKGIPNTIPEPADIVLVLDYSSSMSSKFPNENSDYNRFYYVKAAARLAVNTLLPDNNNEIQNRIGIVWFDERADNREFNQIFTSDKSTLLNNIRTKKMHSGTNYQGAFWEAQKMIENNSGNNRKKFVIFVTDGSPYDYHVGTKEIPGNTSSNQTTAKEKAVEAVKGFNGLINGFYAVSVGSTSGYEFLKNKILEAVQATDEAILEANDEASLTNAFSTILGSITKQIGNVTITDTLSKYVNFVGEDGLGLKQYDTDNDGKIKGSKGDATAQKIGLKVNISDYTNKDTYDAHTSIKTAAEYQGNYTYEIDLNAKTIKVNFGKDYFLERDKVYTISFNVMLTEQATEDAVKTQNTSGDTQTDYPGNATSSQKLGLYSNTEASLSYERVENGVIKPTTKNDYEKPVVQPYEKADWLIRKVSSSNEALTLPNAVFQLKRKTDNLTYTGTSDRDGVVSWKDSNGEVVASNQIEKGEYTLKETQAPDGYMKSNNEWTVSIGAKGMKPVVALGETEVSLTQNATTSVYELKIVNEAIYSLPSTGGTGIFVYTIGGTLLLMAAALLIYKMKREEVLKG